MRMETQHMAICRMLLRKYLGEELKALNGCIRREKMVSGQWLELHPETLETGKQITTKVIRRKEQI